MFNMTMVNMTYVFFGALILTVATMLLMAYWMEKSGESDERA